MFKQKWDTARDRGVIRLFTTAKTMVWEGLSLLALSSKLPMRTMPFKQKLLFKIQLLWHISLAYLLTQEIELRNKI